MLLTTDRQQLNQHFLLAVKFDYSSGAETNETDEDMSDLNMAKMNQVKGRGRGGGRGRGRGRGTGTGTGSRGRVGVGVRVGCRSKGRGNVRGKGREYE